MLRDVRTVGSGAAGRLFIALMVVFATGGCGLADAEPEQDTSDERTPHTPTEGEPTPPAEGEDAGEQSDGEGGAEGQGEAPALADWDGRRYDLGEASNPRRIDDGIVVEWNRYGLRTYEGDEDLDEEVRERDPEAFAWDPVEPYSEIAYLSVPGTFTDDNPRVRDLKITSAAWIFEVDGARRGCPQGPDTLTSPPPPWRGGTLEGWMRELEEGEANTVLLTYDAVGRVVQVRPATYC